MMRRRTQGVVFIAVLCIAAWAGGCVANENPLERAVKIAMAEESWLTTKTAAERLTKIREVTLLYDIVSDPVSDRYLITRYGGPIDLVHFLGLAVLVASGEQEREASLHKQWKAEGGPDFEAGKTRSYPTEAHPDDLPANALGALFGDEIRSQNTKSAEEFDVVTAFRDFLGSFGIVEDSIAKRFSHRTIVMGLDKDSSRELDTSRREWFTAKPLFILPLVAPDEAKVVTDARLALKKAGFVLTEIEGREIGVERIK